MDVRKMLYGDEIIRLATSKDLNKHFIIHLFFTALFLLTPLCILSYIMITNIFAKFFILLSSALGILLLIYFIKFILKYYIKKEPYEYYVYSGRAGKGIVKGYQLGLPNNFADLTKEQKEAIDNKTYHPHTYKGYSKVTYDNKTPFSSKLVFIFIGISFIGFLVIYMYQYLEVNDYTSDSITLAIIGFLGTLVMFGGPLIGVFVITNSKNKESKNNISDDPFENKSSKYYIDSEDPFKDFDK